MSRPQTPGYTVRRPPINAQLNSTIARSGTPPRPVISLEEWESKTTLTDDQLQSISLVKEKLGQRPFPSRFAHAETSAQGASRPTTPTGPRPARVTHLLASPNRSRPPSSPGSPAPGSTHLLSGDLLHPGSITTPQQFHEHFAALTLSTEHEQDSLYRDHLGEIIGLRENCDALIEVLKEGEGEVGEMLKALEYVEEKSESLRGACEDLLEEQTHLLTHTSQLAHRLTFFTFLETAQRMLNTPKPDLVLSDDFLPMVKRLDECLGYLSDHRDFKDSEVYLLRYQQCMTRSMTLIKIYFVNTIKALGQEVSKRLAEKALGETAAEALLYTKFATLSGSLRPLLMELEYRVKVNPTELSSLLYECHSAWVSVRQTLMGSRVSDEVRRMDPTTTDLVDLTRTGCSYLKQTCIDEFTLYKHFFLSGESPLYGFLESLCDHLYDNLRPRILHEPSLEVLCGVCTVLQALMVQDVVIEEDIEEVIANTPGSTPNFSPYGHEGNDYFSLADETFSARQRRTGSVRGYSGSILTRREMPRRNRKPLDRLHIEVLLRMVLQDAQTRLVFRAQSLLRADVEYFAPREGDLAYPDKIKGQSGKLVERQMSYSLDAEDDDAPAFLSLPPVEVQNAWYPSLRVTLWILSCLYTYVDNAVFDDLAQEAIVLCRKSLSVGSDLIAAKKDKTIDAKLFLVRHLLILKEMTAGLNLGKKDRSRDWRGITDFLKTLLDNASYMLGYGRGATRSVDFAADAKVDVDRHLKIACEDLIQICTASANAPLTAYLDKCTAYLASRPSSATDLSAQSFATPDQVNKVHTAFKNNVKAEVDNWVSTLSMYLQDADTVSVLIPPTYGSIVEAYRQFHDLVRAEYDFSTAAGILTPAGVQNLLDSGATEKQ